MLREPAAAEVDVAGVDRELVTGDVVELDSVDGVGAVGFSAITG